MIPIIALYTPEEIIIVILSLVIILILTIIVGYSLGVKETRRTLKETISVKTLP